MLFEFTRRSGAKSNAKRAAEVATFRIANLSRQQGGRGLTDVSHLIDRTYDYRSPRELRWHLAERFGLAPQAVALRETV